MRLIQPHLSCLLHSQVNEEEYLVSLHFCLILKEILSRLYLRSNGLHMVLL